MNILDVAIVVIQVQIPGILFIVLAMASCVVIGFSCPILSASSS